MREALVVGAGPAGSIAALVLARAGVSVRLLDRSRFPRDKLCGDTLNPGSLALLSEIDARGIVSAIRQRALSITGMTVTGPRGAQVSADYPSPFTGAALTRRDLDSILLDAAVDAGACLEEGVAVRAPVMDSDGTTVRGVRVSNGREHVFDARVVIAADGRGSRLASALQLSRFARAPRRWAFGAYFDGVAGVTTRGEMHVRRDGYIGVAPLPGGLANVCVVRGRGARASGLGTRGSEQVFGRVIEDALLDDPMLRERCAGARRVSEVTCLGPLAVDATAAGCPGLLLAGDAAGFIDPMTGDGLRFALRGGMLAAAAAIRELETGVPAYGELAAARRREFAVKTGINRTLRALVSYPSGVVAAALISRLWAAPVGQLVRIAGDVPPR